MRIPSWGLAAALALAACGAGCGGDEQREAPSGRAWGGVRAEGRRAPERALASNSAPRIETVRLEPAQPRAREPVRAVVEASDPDGDPLRFEYVWTVNGKALPDDGPRASLGQTLKGDSVEVTVTASDGRATSVPFVASARVRNRAPKLRAVRIEPAGQITTGGEVVAVPHAEDSDGDPVAFHYTWWVNGERVAEEESVLATRRLRRGDTIRVRVVAEDGQDESNAIESPEIRVSNAAPTIVSEPEDPGADGVFRYRVRAEDPDGDRTLRYSLDTAPRGMTVSPTRGEIEWVPGFDQAGKHPVEIVVDDLQGGRAFQRFEVVVGASGEDGEGSETAPPASPAE